MEAGPHDTLQCRGETQHAPDDASQPERSSDSTVILRADPLIHGHSSASTYFENGFTEAWPEDAPVADKYAKPTQTQAQAHRDRILDTSLSINTLPLEILLRIFWLSVFQSLHNQYLTPIPNPFQRDDRRDLVVLTHVCAHWRAVLLNTQAFWSRFEFSTRESPVDVGNWARVYCERAPDVPLSFYINERELSSLNGNLMIEYIRPRLDRLERMALINLQGARHARKFIHFWMKRGKPGTLRTLIIRLDTEYFWYHETISTQDPSLTRQRVESFLGPIRVLYLSGVRFEWDSPAYQNLVVLRLGSFSQIYSPQIREILAILTACPQLHTLQLYEMLILPSDTCASEPVHLNELENLGLTELSPESISLLLARIFSRSKNLALRMGSLRIDEKLILTCVRPFLARNNVTRLFIQRSIDVESDDISRYLSALPNLHTLLVDLDHLSSDKILSCLTYMNESNNAHMPICPQLHTLYLINGTVSTGAIRQMVETHPCVRKLRFSDCTINPSEEELHRWLKTFVVDVRFDVKVDRAEVFDWYHLMD
ncbi:hypothetical protein B0J17DRAFT_680354 [Rhizoctonia solani]|nr:hypothetical protein B0J17DRAFT_680354 [Rhizoctonia solani]